MATSVRHFHGFCSSFFFCVCLLCEVPRTTNWWSSRFQQSRPQKRMYIRLPRGSPIQVCIPSHLTSLCVPLNPRTANGAGVVFRCSEPRYIPIVSFVLEVSVEHPVECRCCVSYPGIESTPFLFGRMWILRRLALIS